MCDRYEGSDDGRSESGRGVNRGHGGWGDGEHVKCTVLSVQVKMTCNSTRGVRDGMHSIVLTYVMCVLTGLGRGLGTAISQWRMVS